MTLDKTLTSFPLSFFSRNRLGRILALLALGGATGWVFAPYNAWWVTFITFPPLLALIAPLGGWAAARAVWLFSFGYFTAGLYWISNALLLDIASFWWALPLAMTGLPILLALFHAPAGWGVQHFFSGRSALLRVCAFAVFWSLAEYARGHLFTGFPWLMTGYLWVDVDWARSLAGLGGAYFLSLWAVLLACLPYAFVFLSRQKDTPLRNRAAPALAGVALLAFAFGYAHYSDRPNGQGLTGTNTSSANKESFPLATENTLTLRLVQPNIEQSLKIDANARAHMLTQTLVAMTDAPLKTFSETSSESPPETFSETFSETSSETFSKTFPNGRSATPHIVILPESAIPYRIEGDLRLRQLLTSALPDDALLLAGVVRKSSTGSYYNSLVGMNKNGDILGFYDKTHLVPFGEYIPFRRWLPFDPIAGVEDFSVGEGLKTLFFENKPSFSPLICYEAIFPGKTISAQERPAWILNITNDGWYGLSHGPHQHLAIARVRAVEQGLPLVRVANTGISAVINADGLVQSSLPLGQSGRLDATIRLTSKTPPYSYAGDWIYHAVIAFFLSVFVVFSIWDRQKSA